MKYHIFLQLSIMLAKFGQRPAAEVLCEDLRSLFVMPQLSDPGLSDSVDTLHTALCNSSQSQQLISLFLQAFSADNLARIVSIGITT